MSRPGVTFSEVADAASHLIGQGKNSTIEQIRLLLGTGSSTTIANHLKQWKERQQGTSLLSAKESIPQELVEMMKGLWARVISLSQEKINSAEVQFEKTLAAMQSELTKYKNNNQRWQQMFNQWQQEKEKLFADQLTLEQANRAILQEKTLLEAKLGLQEKQMQEKQNRIDELKENAVFSQQLSEIRDEVKELKDQNKVLTREKWEIAQEKAQMEGRMKQLETV